MEEPKTEEKNQEPQNPEVDSNQVAESPVKKKFNFEKLKSKKAIIGILIAIFLILGIGGAYTIVLGTSGSENNEAEISEVPTPSPELTEEVTPIINPEINSAITKSVSPTSGATPTPSTAIINVKIQDDKTRQTLTDSGFEIYITSSENNYSSLSRSNEASFTNLKPGNYDVSVNAPTSFFHRESGCGDNCGTSISNENKCAIRMHVGGGGTINMYCTYDRF